MRRPFPRYPRCPVCGDPDVNPAALAVRWSWDADAGEVVGSFTPSADHAGYAGRTHGGLLSALLDECLAWAAAVSRRSYCMTGELSLRFKRPARTGDPIAIRGRVTEARGPYVRTEGEILSARGDVLATATATFAALPRSESEAMRAALDLSPADVDVLDDDETFGPELPPGRRSG